jgi:hypothetical protein
MINLTVQSIFLGFSLYTLLKVLITNSIDKENLLFNDHVDDSAVFVVRYSGIVFLFVLIFTITGSVINSKSEMDYYSVINRMFGPYWFGFWIYPLAYSFLTQLLWINRFKTNSAFRCIIAFVILIAVSTERIVIILTSLYRDYLPSSWAYSASGPIRDFILKSIIGLTIILVTHKIRTGAKSLYNDVS